MDKNGVLVQIRVDKPELGQIMTLCELGATNDHI